MLRTKVIRATTKVVDAEKGTVHAIVSTEAVDRDGDIIRQEGWDLKSFLAHPVLISSHNYHSLQSQIGEWESMEVKGTQLEGVARYYIGEGNEEADWGFKLAQHNRAAFSVGFIPDMEKAEKLSDDGWFGTFEYKGQELLEVSHVTVPSNPEALAAVKAAGIDSPAIRGIIDEILGEDDPDPAIRDLPEDLALLVAEFRRVVAGEIAKIPEAVAAQVEHIIAARTAADPDPEPEPAAKPGDPDYDAGDPESTDTDDDDYGDGDEPPEEVDREAIAASVETALREALAADPQEA